jgi:hypothetical protein
MNPTPIHDHLIAGIAGRKIAHVVPTTPPGKLELE